jgi:hypothetical protein
MKTVLKITLGILLAVVVLIVGCTALIGAGVNEAQKDSDKTSITVAEYESVKVGPGGNSRDRLVSRFGEPSSAQEVKGEVPEAGLDCIYYNREGEFASIYQFCFGADGRAETKSSF